MILANSNPPTVETDLQVFLYVLLAFAIIAVVVLAIVITVAIINHTYRSFVSNHSLALRELLAINKKYYFLPVSSIDYSHSYDNENFYTDISPKDYLTYQLVYDRKKVIPNLKNAKSNKETYKRYFQEIKSVKMDVYDTDQLPRNKKKLTKTENKLFVEKSLYPTTDLYIYVRLSLTNIEGRYRTSKRQVFDSNEITYIINCLNQKQGDFYLDKNIWDSLCRVERGKVTNRMRFAIYKRDGNRCRKCGRRTNDLEIDHILPISKGGKSTMDNLQTLCKRCNLEKGSRYERYFK